MGSTLKLYGLIALVVLWMATVGVAFWAGGLNTRKAAAEKESALTAALVKGAFENLEAATKQEKVVVETIRRVEVPVTKLETVIRETQAVCPLPPAVDSQLRDALGEANAVIRSTL